MFGPLKRQPKPPQNPWRVVNEFWGGPDYDPDRVEYPDTTRMVDLSVVNGNVSHGMKGFYLKEKWFTDDWSPAQGVFIKEIPRGITVAAWREV